MVIVGENVSFDTPKNQLMLAYANCALPFCLAGQSQLNHDSHLECCIFKFLHERIQPQ